VDSRRSRHKKHGEPRKVVGLSRLETVAGKHFPQEDQARAIAEFVAGIARHGEVVSLKKTA